MYESLMNFVSSSYLFANSLAIGNEYLFNYAISDDTAGIDWYINDEFGNIVVPSGFDDDLYIGVVMSVE